MYGRGLSLPLHPTAFAFECYGKIQLPLKIIRIANQTLNCPFYRNIRFEPMHSAHQHHPPSKSEDNSLQSSFNVILFLCVTQMNLTIRYEMVQIKARQ